ncbi:MAG: ABC transporter ATP-binding protein [Clostridia bacterium]|nr:ABC transporter ATP-binding protein [Clostridia bacterium]
MGEVEGDRPPAALEVEDVSKVYLVGPGVRALRRVSLAIPAGSFLALTGPSGSGKSTLLHLMGGLDRPTSGEVRLEGRPYSRLGPFGLARLRRRAIGFVFQQFHLVQELTALENVELPMRLLGREGPAVRREAESLLARVGLASRAHHFPYELSGGEQQRVAVARALANRPAVLLADEPTGNLDRASAETLVALFQEFHAAGQTIVVATHDPLVVRAAARVVRLEDGRVVADGPAAGGDGR